MSCVMDCTAPVVHCLKSSRVLVEPELENELQELTALLDFEESDQQTTSSECTPPVQPDKSGTNPNKPRALRDFDIFDKENDPSDATVKKLPSLSQVFSKNTEQSKHEKSEIHHGDTDSSDDEDNKYRAEQKYTDNGRAIKNMMKKPTTTTTTNAYTNNSSWKSNKSVFAPSEATPPSRPIPARDIYTDPYFGIRIITPLISSQVLNERMQGKTAVSFSRLQNHIANTEKTNDWVVAGVIVSKFLKTSQKGKPYVCWTLSDLREGLKTVTLFLFGKAYQKLWKTSTHIVVAILNPTPLDNKKTSNDIAALSVTNPDQVMIWGQSKDLGTCKARKNNGEPCKVIVNMNQCDYCIYHVKQEYRKFTARGELQAPSGGSLNQLKNKILGKNEVFYAGRSYTASVAKPVKKQVAKDQKRLSQLFNQCESRFGPQSESARVIKPQSARVQLMRDAERLQKLTGSPATLSSLANEDKSINGKEVCKSIDKGVLKTNKNTETNKIKRDLDALEITFPETVNSGEKLYPVSVSSEKTEKFKKENKDPVINKSLLGKGNLVQDKPDNLSLTKTRFKGPKDVKIIKNKKERISKIGTKTTPSHQKFGTGGSKPSTTNMKKQPTKNRFDSLTKLKSVNHKTSESGIGAMDKNDKSKTSHSSQSPTVFDVCFEFDESKIPGTSRLEKIAVFSKNTLKKDSAEAPKSVKCTLGTKQVDSCNESEGVRTPSLNKSPTLLSEGRTSINLQSSVECNESPGLSPPQVVSTTTHPLKQILPSRQSAAKLRALRYVKSKGPIIKQEPNEKKTSETKELTAKSKRKRTDTEEEENSKNDKSSLSERFIELMNATSKHTDLIINAENKELDEYYDKMEKKEQMEEKMLNTYKLECKAVRCLKCNYKWFSASDQCKAENHPIKVISAVKRFFQCQNCKRRTVSLDIIPLHNCSGCGLGNWIRVPMMQERKSSNVHLSIRGGEQKFTNSVVTGANLDLLVPDDNS